MDMVLVVVHFLDVEHGVVVGDVEQFPLHVREETIVEYLSSIFGRKDDVVVTEIDRVCSLAILVAHRGSVRHLGRGQNDSGTRLHPRARRHGVLGCE
jgi:hypothetical protein